MEISAISEVILKRFRNEKKRNTWFCISRKLASYNEQFPFAVHRDTVTAKTEQDTSHTAKQAPLHQGGQHVHVNVMFDWVGKVGFKKTAMQNLV